MKVFILCSAIAAVLLRMLESRNVTSRKRFIKKTDEYKIDNTVRRHFEDMVTLSDILEENNIDFAKIGKSIGRETILSWENENGVVLPREYKEFLLLSNGFNYGTIIFPLEQIRLLDDSEEFGEYYWIGDYIGDGSKLLSDKNGGFYYGNHTMGVEMADFKEFLEEYFLRPMYEDLKDNGIDVPDNLNIKLQLNHSFLKQNEENGKEQEEGLKIVELTEVQRRKIIGDHTIDYFKNPDKRHVNIFSGVYDSEYDITLTMISWASSVLTRGAEESVYQVFTKKDTYVVRDTFEFINETPYGDDIIKRLIRYYNHNVRTDEKIQNRVISRYENKYNTKIDYFLKWYIEEIARNSKIDIGK